MAHFVLAIDDVVNTVVDYYQFSNTTMLELDDGTEWYVFEEPEEAGAAARKYWEDLADNDPKEFAAVVGEEALIAWGREQNYAPGCVGVSSLEEWFDLVENTPEDLWGSYDGTESVCRINKAMMRELGFEHLEGKRHEFVCYRFA